jgi:preprotein translocase subunit YajC
VKYSFSSVSLFCSPLLLPSLAFAQAQSTESLPPEPSGFQMLVSMFPMFAMVFLIFYLMVIKPQQVKQTEHKRLIKDLKKGDSVVTSGGIFGRIVSIESDHFLLEVATNVRIRIENQHVVKKLDKVAVEKAA